MKIIHTCWRTAVYLLALSSSARCEINEALKISDNRNGIRRIDHGLIHLDHSVQEIERQVRQASPTEPEDATITPAAHLELRDTSAAQGAVAIAVLIDAVSTYTVSSSIGSNVLIIGDNTLAEGGSPIQLDGNVLSVQAEGLVANGGQTFTVNSPSPQSAASDAGSAPSAVSAAISAPLEASVASGAGSAPSAAPVASGAGSAPSAASAGVSALSATSLTGSFPSATSVASFSSSTASTAGSGNGSFAAPGTGVVKQVNPTAFTQFSDLSTSNTASELGGYSLPFLGILMGTFVILLA